MTPELFFYFTLHLLRWRSAHQSETSGEYEPRGFVVWCNQSVGQDLPNNVWLLLRLPGTSCSLSIPQTRSAEAFVVKTAGSWSILQSGQKLIQLLRCTHIKHVEQYHHIRRHSVSSSTMSHEFLVAVDSFFLVSPRANLFAFLSREPHLLDSTFVTFAGQVFYSRRLASARYSLNVWTDGSQEVWR